MSNSEYHSAAIHVNYTHEGGSLQTAMPRGQRSRVARFPTMVVRINASRGSSRDSQWCRMKILSEAVFCFLYFILLYILLSSFLVLVGVFCARA